jgi:hypothetical protein
MLLDEAVAALVHDNIDRSKPNVSTALQGLS